MTTSLGKVYKNILWFVLIHSVYKAWALQDWGTILRLVMEKNVSLVCCFNVSVINCHAEHFSVRCYSPLVMSTVVLVNSTGFDTSPLLSHMGCIPRFISHWVFIFSIRGGWFVVLVFFFCFVFFTIILMVKHVLRKDPLLNSRWSDTSACCWTQNLMLSCSTTHAVYCIDWLLDEECFLK